MLSARAHGDQPTPLERPQDALPRAAVRRKVEIEREGEEGFLRVVVLEKELGLVGRDDLVARLHLARTDQQDVGARTEAPLKPVSASHAVKPG